MVCQVDSVREIPVLDNKSMREVGMAPVNFFSHFVRSPTQWRQLVTYVKQHPDSYVGLWETIRQVNEGYDPLLDSAYASLSTALQQTYSGSVLAQRLASGKALAIGQLFPALGYWIQGAIRWSCQPRQEPSIP